MNNNIAKNSENKMSVDISIHIDMNGCADGRRAWYLEEHRENGKHSLTEALDAEIARRISEKEKSLTPKGMFEPLPGGIPCNDPNENYYNCLWNEILRRSLENKADDTKISQWFAPLKLAALDPENKVMLLESDAKDLAFTEEIVNSYYGMIEKPVRSLLGGTYHLKLAPVIKAS